MPSNDVSEDFDWAFKKKYCLTPNLRQRTDGYSEYQIWFSLSIPMLDLVSRNLPGSHSANWAQCSSSQYFRRSTELDTLSVRYSVTIVKYRWYINSPLYIHLLCRTLPSLVHLITRLFWNNLLLLDATYLCIEDKFYICIQCWISATQRLRCW